MPPPIIKVTKQETEEEKMAIIKKLNDMFDFIHIKFNKSKGKIVSIHGDFDIYWEEKNNAKKES